jgi:hypothetical protein
MNVPLQKTLPSLSVIYLSTLVYVMTSRWYPFTFYIHWGVSFVMSALAALALIAWGGMRLVHRVLE